MNKRRVPLWLPYLQSIKETKKGVFEFVFNGGTETTDLASVSSIMTYGETDAELSTKIVDKIVRRGIPIIIHRRNLAQSISITAGLRPDPEDTLSAQIIKRRQSRTQTHVARQILIAKMRSMSWLVPPRNVPRIANIKKLRNIEAVHARAYWAEYFRRLGHPEWTRRSNNPAAQSLDSASKFITGIILRWISYHHLSPYHGFFHETTDYPALVYDLIEPYRGMFEAKLLEVFTTAPQDRWLTASIDALKTELDTKTYVPLTRQIVTKQELLHGIVLSLKFYVLGKQRRFLVPLAGKPKGGRPPKVDFLLYGRHAGKTDFWKVAREVRWNLKAVPPRRPGRYSLAQGLANHRQSVSTRKRR
jgi:hypothetical protein